MLFRSEQSEPLMKPHVLLALMAFGCSPVMTEDRSASWPLDLEIEGPAVHKCLKAVELSPSPMTIWWVSGLGEKDADGNESFDSVRPPAKFELIEDLGKREEEGVLAGSGKKITITYHEYWGTCTFD